MCGFNKYCLYIFTWVIYKVDKAKIVYINMKMITNQDNSSSCCLKRLTEITISLYSLGPDNTLFFIVRLT